jgi:hypothetical protein
MENLGGQGATMSRVSMPSRTSVMKTSRLFLDNVVLFGVTVLANLYCFDTHSLTLETLCKFSLTYQGDIRRQKVFS